MLLKKSPKKCCGIKLRNNRIRQANPLNQHCAFEADIESIFPNESAKILFQQHRSQAVRLRRSKCFPVFHQHRTFSCAIATSVQGHCLPQRGEKLGAIGASRREIANQ
jgi:hypothetical protein